MRRTLFTIACPAIVILLVAASGASAGVFSDDLGKCLVSSTTSKDKTDLVRWMFANAALHPEVRSISALTDDQKKEIDKTTGEMFERLLTEGCKEQFRNAMKYEGEAAIEGSFGILGGVAMQELMSNASVTEGFAALDQYISQEKLEEAVGADEP